MDYKDLQWAATGERLTAESFARYRKQKGLVIGHQFSEDLVKKTIANPLTMIASDGELNNGKGHPRTSGTYSRVLGHYVRETKTLTLMDALRRMTLIPAQRLEQRIPMTKNKGRIRVGADADITIFDAEKIIDKSTYEEPAKYSAGVMYVLVSGVLVVNNGQLKMDIAPGQPVRAPIKK
jgi:dihydroorotase